MENKRVVDINIYWAEIVRDTAQFGQIAVAENPEFNRLSECIFRALEDSFIHSATEYGVSRWEKMLQIAPSSTDTLDDRKARVLTYLNLKLPYTWRVLKQLLENIVGEGNVQMNLDNDTQTLHIVFNDKVDASVSNTIDDLISRVIPMNLVVEYDFTGVPFGYTHLEYIESSGTQYLSIPFVANAADSAVMIETEHYSIETIAYQGEGCGTFMFMGVLTSNKFYVGSNTIMVNAGSLELNNWNVHKALFENNKVTIFLPDGTTYVKTHSLAAKSFDYYSLFKTSYSSWTWAGRKRTWKAWIDGELQFDLVPVLDSHGVPCMFDKVSKQSFYNAGTGTFGYALKESNLKQKKGL